MGCSPSKVVPANPDHEQGLGGIEDPRELEHYVKSHARHAYTIAREGVALRDGLHIEHKFARCSPLSGEPWAFQGDGISFEECSSYCTSLGCSCFDYSAEVSGLLTSFKYPEQNE